MNFFRFFGKYTMNQYPPAAKRKYAHTVEFRGFLIGLYRSEKPCFEVGEMPVYDLYFVLDDMGDPVLPVDLPLGSLFQCHAAIDLFHYLKDNPAFKLTHPGKSIWTYLQENTRYERHLGDVMNFLRDIETDVRNLNADPDFGDDLQTFQKKTERKIGEFFGRVNSWQSPTPLT